MTALWLLVFALIGVGIGVFVGRVVIPREIPYPLPVPPYRVARCAFIAAIGYLVLRSSYGLVIGSPFLNWGYQLGAYVHACAICLGIMHGYATRTYAPPTTIKAGLHVEDDGGLVLVDPTSDSYEGFGASHPPQDPPHREGDRP